ncbi:MAG: UDP-N-acetylmuramoyl-L-alanyl-D-glutamate--2,6-diaminopimelate ligase [Dehalococcoidia bacterium]
MLLADLLKAASIVAKPSLTPVEITGIAYDSRRVEPGNLFVAVSGFHADGARFVGDAFARGAAAAVMSRRAIPDAGLSHEDVRRRVVAAPDTRAALASLAAAWYDFPARELTTIGVTGTDGKTSTSYLIAEILNAAGIRTGLFTTVAYQVGGVWEANETRQTTPEALEVQLLLRRMVDAGDRCAVLESTSHGLELHKLDHCDYDVAVFTNLSPDHLDFHGTVQRYRKAKARLFSMLDSGWDRGAARLAVLNADDPSAKFMARHTRAPTMTYAIDAPADLRPHSWGLEATGTDFRVWTDAGEIVCHLPLPGRFNFANALAAAGVALGLGVSPYKIGRALSRVKGVPGRMQRIDVGQPFTVIVDYAHTGAAFAKALAALEVLTERRKIVVFGCAGERGAERRTGMGEVAARQADYAIVTTEDPRSEDPDAIIDEIAAAMRSAGADEGNDFERVPDRRAAIARAFEIARRGDLVLLAGKGHEHSIETASGRIPWDEAAIAEALLRERFGTGEKISWRGGQNEQPR